MFAAPDATHVLASEEQMTQEIRRATPRGGLSICAQGDPGREQAEEFVRRAFARKHGAHIESFMPSLLMLTGSEGRLRAVAGCRSADAQPLFLERYLEWPIEVVIAAQAGRQVRRSQIAEVGNFACSNSRIAAGFILQLAQFLLERGFLWVAFTATVAVRDILTEMNVGCVELAEAKAGSVRGGRDDWGRYYANDPRVMAGFLPVARNIPSLSVGVHAD